MFPRIATAGVLAALCAALAPAAARGGSYHVYGCRTPGGEAAPVDGWSGTKVGSFTHAENTCGLPGGALVAALGDQAARTANTDSATWAFTAAPATHIAN